MSKVCTYRKVHFLMSFILSNSWGHVSIFYFCKVCVISFFLHSLLLLSFLMSASSSVSFGVVGCGKGDGYLTSLGRPTDIGFQSGKACYPFSRQG